MVKLVIELLAKGFMILSHGNTETKHITGGVVEAESLKLKDPWLWVRSSIQFSLCINLHITISYH